MTNLRTSIDDEFNALPNKVILDGCNQVCCPSCGIVAKEEREILGILLEQLIERIEDDTSLMCPWLLSFCNKCRTRYGVIYSTEYREKWFKDHTSYEDEWNKFYCGVTA